MSISDSIDCFASVLIYCLNLVYVAKVDSCLLELFPMFGFPNFFLFNFSLLIVDIVPGGSPVRFTCLCLSVMRSHLLYSIFGLAWLIVGGGLSILSVALVG